MSTREPVFTVDSLIPNPVLRSCILAGYGYPHGHGYGYVAGASWSALEVWTIDQRMSRMLALQEVLQELQ
eukprot:1058515-Prorocentrum_minimum.AAC.1